MWFILGGKSEGQGNEQAILARRLFNLKGCDTLFIWEYKRIKVTGHLVFTMKWRIH